ncbi:hypothetical protein [Hymenobacter amundsenii]|nr:hypothetical protein [Hymenobacter amundsenii]
MPRGTSTRSSVGEALNTRAGTPASQIQEHFHALLDQRFNQWQLV